MYLDDFKSVLDDVEELLQEGAKKPGRFRGQWKEDRHKEYHAEKAISHIDQAYPDNEFDHWHKDPETGKSHLINAIARLLIAEQRNRNES
jgi:hypothetical protein